MDPTVTRIAAILDTQQNVIEADDKAFDAIWSILMKDWSLKGLEEIHNVLTRRMKGLAK